MNSTDPEQNNEYGEDMRQTRRLLRIMRRLRGKDGCPWDAEQTLESLKPYLIEECGEVLEAIEQGSMDALEDELGDLLLQVVFQCRICEEKQHFDFEDVARRICEKLIRRHPHVFGEQEVEGASEVVRNWEVIKKKEGNGTADPGDSVLEPPPRHLPALMRAQELQRQASEVGFDWQDVSGVVDKVEEEVGELKEVMRDGGQDQIQEELGDLLFAVVNLARWVDVDSEEALGRTIRKFRRRFEMVEERLAERAKTPADSSLREMDAIWDEQR
ncbi:MAG: nucleoside triphosphate pyrophosphohydrolase [Planctomycetota bacterium]